jgi:6-phosphogluconolactonase
MDNKKEVKLFKDKIQVVEYLSEKLLKLSLLQSSKVNIGISGGNTPKYLFEYLVNSPYRTKINWKKINIFWCDERCVPKDHRDSNYGMTEKLLLNNIDIPRDNIHHIMGESNPEIEAIRYADVIEKYVPKENGIPVFDWILLGLGPDGHTASIFQDSKEAFSSERLCEETQHPITGQNRITMTPKLINHAKRITFMVMGKDKSVIVREILFNSDAGSKYPVCLIKPDNSDLEWILDNEAGEGIQI